MRPSNLMIRAHRPEFAMLPRPTILLELPDMYTAHAVFSILEGVTPRLPRENWRPSSFPAYVEDPRSQENQQGSASSM